MINREWLESRQRGLGGSDAAAVLGMDAWRSGLDVWRSKVEPIPEATDDENFLFKLGHLLEPVIAGLYSEQTGRELFIPEPEIITHLKYPEIVGSPDRLAPKDGRVIELKSEHQFADKFGDPGSDQVPDHYVIQAAHYMAVANLDRCDVAVLHGGFKFAIYQLRRDLEMERSMIDQLRHWWDAYVVKKIEPPLDASEAWGDYLAQKYPLNRGPIVQVDENSQPALMRHVFNALNYADVIANFKSRLEGARNEVKAFIADNDGIRGPWGKITWRLCKDSTETRINFDKVLATLQKRFGILDRELAELREQCMESVVTKKGGRRFIAKRAKDAAESEMLPEERVG
ncbi:MAG TPA: YqaJ viral recombinase family protein [Terriglobales bacterium]|nr:YqaJ viral recombinase family protein [Terriglobales bacterium]